MNEQPYYAIVVDTSVARSASETQNPTSIHCRETLEALDNSGHSLAMSDPLWEEWNRRVLDRPAGFWDKYASRYAMEWYASMQMRSRVRWADLLANNPLRDQAVASASILWPGSHVPEEIEKDFPLIETAIATDRRVISLNDRQRQQFKRIAQDVPDIGTILWIDPDREDTPGWLHDGAPEMSGLHLLTH